jgi:hypothetical protein
MTTPTPPPAGLPLRWALILFSALVVGMIFGALTFIRFGVAAGVLAGLTAAGATVKGLHEVLGSA